MAGKSPYAIHEDFSAFPVLNIRFNKLIIGLINLFLLLQRWFSERRLLRGATLHRVSTAPGVQIEVYAFRPQGAKEGTPLPALLYYHGGAYAITYASSHIVSAQRYADEANCAVYLVDYRLAPWHRFPAAMDDSYGALQWVLHNASSLGVDSQRVVVGGDSAGGGLAASVAQRYLDEAGEALCGQLLIYPTTDCRCTTTSAREFTDAPMWSALSNQRMWQAYLGDYDPEAPPAYASPGQRENLWGLPSAYVETAEFDPLRDEGEAYAKALKAAGVTVDFNATRGTVHGYDAVLTSEITQAAYGARIEFLKTAFGA